MSPRFASFWAVPGYQAVSGRGPRLSRSLARVHECEGLLTRGRRINGTKSGGLAQAFFVGVRRRGGHASSDLPIVCRMADVFRALDDETRRLILDELSTRDGQTLFEICTLLSTRHGLGSTRQAISQHLAVLEDAGLVVTERRGRSKFHYFNSEPLAAITRRWPVVGKGTQ